MNFSVNGAACMVTTIATQSNVADSTPIMEPVINFVPGSGPSQITVPIDNPTFLDGVTGQPFITVNKPGDIDAYSAGYSRGEALLAISFYNKTPYSIADLNLNIIGTSVEPVPYTFNYARTEC